MKALLCCFRLKEEDIDSRLQKKHSYSNAANKKKDIGNVGGNAANYDIVVDTPTITSTDSGFVDMPACAANLGGGARQVNVVVRPAKRGNKTDVDITPEEQLSNGGGGSPQSSLVVQFEDEYEVKGQNTAEVILDLSGLPKKTWWREARNQVINNTDCWKAWVEIACDPEKLKTESGNNLQVMSFARAVMRQEMRKCIGEKVVLPASYIKQKKYNEQHGFPNYYLSLDGKFEIYKRYHFTSECEKIQSWWNKAYNRIKNNKNPGDAKDYKEAYLDLAVNPILFHQNTSVVEKTFAMAVLNDDLATRLGKEPILQKDYIAQLKHNQKIGIANYPVQEKMVATTETDFRIAVRPSNLHAERVKSGRSTAGLAPISNSV